MCQGRLILHRAIPVSSKNRSFTAFGVSRSEIGIAGRNVTVTPWSGCDEYGHHLCKVRGTQLTQDKPDDKM